MQRKMKTLMIHASFLSYLLAFLGTQARTLPEHPHDKLFQFTPTRMISVCKEENFCNFLARKTDYERTPNPPPPPPGSSSGPTPIKVISMVFPFDKVSNYGRTSSPPPPSPSSAPPTKEVSSTSNHFLEKMINYGRSSSPPPPSLSSAPPTHEISSASNRQTMADYGRAASPPPPSPSSSPPTHQLTRNGLLLEKSTPNPNVAST